MLTYCPLYRCIAGLMADCSDEKNNCSSASIPGLVCNVPNGTNQTHGQCICDTANNWTKAEQYCSKLLSRDLFTVPNGKAYMPNVHFLDMSKGTYAIVGLRFERLRRYL